jgi:hypothetical protein
MAFKRARCRAIACRRSCACWSIRSQDAGNTPLIFLLTCWSSPSSCSDSSLASSESDDSPSLRTILVGRRSPLPDLRALRGTWSESDSTNRGVSAWNVDELEGVGKLSVLRFESSLPTCALSGGLLE